MDAEYQEAAIFLQSSSALASLLECSICLSLLCEPISLSCGHTYCRVCLVKSLRHRKQCPGCREVCHLSAECCAENVVIKSMAMVLNAELYEQRQKESAREKATWTTVYPAFFCNQVLLPHNKLNLHLFEPRYKLMMSRVINSNRAFAYVNTAERKMAVGDIALVAEVKEVEFFADGRCIVEAHLYKRSRIVEHYVEDGTQGLHYCRLEPVHDHPVESERNEDLHHLKAAALLLVEKLIDNDHSRRIVSEQYCAMPTVGMEEFSMWLCCICPLTAQDTCIALNSQNTSDRLAMCINRLEVYLEQKRISRTFPIMSALGSSIASTIFALLGTSSVIASDTGDWHGVEGGAPPIPSLRLRGEAVAVRGVDVGGDSAVEDADSVPRLASDSNDSSDADVDGVGETT